MRLRIGTIAIALWGLGMNIALQKGALDWVPGWVVALMLAIPICIWAFLGLTHDRFGKFLRKTKPVTALIVFISVGAMLGGAVGGVIHALYKRSSEAASSEKATITDVTPENVEVRVRQWGKKYDSMVPLKEEPESYW